MSNYLKKFLLAIVIFMMPYVNSASKAIGGEDYGESTMHTHTVRLMTDDQKDVPPFVKQSTSSQIVSLEATEVSLKSFLSSLKGVAKRTYNVFDYATRNPQKAIIIGLFIAYNVASVSAGCSCLGCGSISAGCVGRCSSGCSNSDQMCTRNSDCYGGWL